MHVDHPEKKSLSHPLRKARGALAGSLLCLSAAHAFGCVPSHGILTDTLPTTSDATGSTSDSTVSGSSGTSNSSNSSSSGDTASAGTSASTGASSSSGDATSTTIGTGTLSSTTGSTSDTVTGSTSSTGTGTDTGTDTGGLEQGECRDNSDCDEGAEEECFAPDEVNCGICEQSMDLCSEQEPCEQGTYCGVEILGCPCDEPTRLACLPTCMNDEDCGPDRVCDVDECVFLSCNEGFVCPETHDCLDGGGEGNDCERRSCGTDSDCAGESQVCVEGECFLDFGVCEPPAP